MSRDLSAAVVIIGGGPAGLMAADVLSAAGVCVELFDAMPSVGRKFLLAGIGGLNITHSEPLDDFLDRFHERRAEVEPFLRAFDNTAVRAWMQDLGIASFVGSSGRVFPTEMKAAPLLRAWLQRLRTQGVRISVRHRWLGWTEQGDLRFSTVDGELHVRSSICVLALGGASWKKLGSDGAWLPLLQTRGVAVAPLQPANCGFECQWSAHLIDRFAGQPLKSVALHFKDRFAAPHKKIGELMLTEHGLEGSLIYAFAAPLRDLLKANGHADINIDLLPDRTLSQVSKALSADRGSKSFAHFLQQKLGLSGAKAGLLYEVLTPALRENPQDLAALIKAIPIRLTATRPLDEAISTAGGVEFSALNADLMLHDCPGVFCAGEMLDWEAPTGGYLLTASLASGRQAAAGVLRWLGRCEL